MAAKLLTKSSALVQVQVAYYVISNMDVHTPAQRRRNMQAIRGKDTKPELKLRRALWALGFRYRKNSKSVYGKPDIVFIGQKIAVFVDSEFFHGKNWEENKHRIRSNTEFWWKKIEGNMVRDRKVERILLENGWQIIRFWDTEIVKNLANCIRKIEKAYYGQEVFRGQRGIGNG